MQENVCRQETAHFYIKSSFNISFWYFQQRLVTFEPDRLVNCPIEAMDRVNFKFTFSLYLTFGKYFDAYK